jgi:NADPH-dependent glutamate synthase beta subunit-like oxidoreductase
MESFRSETWDKKLGQASLKTTLPVLPPESDKKIAVIGGGTAGISVAWQLRQQGHQVTIYEVAKTLGGKITQVIFQNRIPKKVINKEMQRIKEVLPQVNLQQPLGAKDIIQLKADFDFIVIATGAQKPRNLPIPGNERTIATLDFLKAATKNKTKVGKNVVIIGAGNVGCDAAAGTVASVFRFARRRP